MNSSWFARAQSTGRSTIPPPGLLEARAAFVLNILGKKDSRSPNGDFSNPARAVSHMDYLKKLARVSSTVKGVGV